MTEVTTLPDTSPLTGTDQVLVLRGGQAYHVTFAELTAQLQIAIPLQAGTLAGRSTAGTGAPQQVGLGAGVAMAAGSLVANGNDHPGFRLLSTMDVQAELVVNSAGLPARLPFSVMRGYYPFSAGNGVSIDANGVISVSLTPDPKALLIEDGAALYLENGIALQIE